MQSDYGRVLLVTTLAGLSTGVGGVLAVTVRPGEALLAAGMGFAGGVMITVSLSDLVPGVLAAYLAAMGPLGAGSALVSLLAMGMLLAALLERCLPEERAFSAVEGNSRRARALHSALVTGIALLLHNLPEGVLTLFAGIQDSGLGLRTALAIAMHNIPEGLAVAVPLFYATKSRKKAVLAALGSGLAEPVGALLALAFFHEVLTPGFLNGMMATVAGIMIWVGAAQLLPAGFGFGHGRATSLGFGAGVVFMLAGIAALS